MKTKFYYYIYKSLDHIFLIKILIYLIFNLFFLLNITDCMHGNSLDVLEAEAKNLTDQIVDQKKAASSHAHTLSSKAKCWPFFTTGSNWFESSVPIPAAEATTISNTLNSYIDTTTDLTGKHKEIISYLKGHQTAVVNEIENQTPIVSQNIQTGINTTEAKLTGLEVSTTALQEQLDKLAHSLSDVKKDTRTLVQTVDNLATKKDTLRLGEELVAQSKDADKNFNDLKESFLKGQEELLEIARQMGEIKQSLNPQDTKDPCLASTKRHGHQ